MKIIISLICFILVGCTDGQFKRVTALGNPAKVVCYSGDKVIYEGMSTGKVSAEQDSDGWFFEDSQTHKLIRVSGDCLIEN